MTEKQIGGNGMAKRQPTVLRVPENGAGDPFFGRQGNWFEVIFESSYDGFYITDGNAITLTLNKSYETISGLRKEEMVGRSMAELVASRVISASGTLLALERRESVTMEQQFKTGKRAIITSTPVFDSESNIVMVVTNVRDVTELYSLKEQLNHESQTRLLSAIKRRQVKPLGYGADKPCDLRIIASTSADLLALVREKKFREDLYYALSVLPINVPPLRERREDIPYIVTAYAAEMNKKYHQKKRFAPETIICMQSYNWPGNIRELHNVVERMMIISKNNVIQPEELPITDNITISQKDSEEYFEQVNLHRLVEQLEISYIRRAYSRYGNVRDAARSLGMDASTFVRKRKKIEQGRE